MIRKWTRKIKKKHKNKKQTFEARVLTLEVTSSSKTPSLTFKQLQIRNLKEQNHEKIISKLKFKMNKIENENISKIQNE